MSERRTGIPKTTRLDTGQGAGPSTAATAPEQSPPEDDPSASASMELTLADDIGKKIAGRYEITDVIGEGGMGVVYEAWDTQVERKVAIKLVRSDTTDRKFLSRFRRELEITSKLRHPSTIRVFEHGETRDKRPYMVMELLTGHSLADRMEQGPLAEMEALQIARQVAESLSEAHEHGVFHRDLKPDNIFIETVGVSKVVKVLDFGIAGGVDATRLTQAGEVFGTPQYMSPEQCNGLPLDHRTDIYSLACILYEMIEGRPPFSAETPMATMLKHVRAKVPPPRKCNKETAKVILMGLRKDRSKRIQTAGRFSELIGQCIGHMRAIQEGRATDRSVPVNTPTTGSLQPVGPAARSPISGPVDAMGYAAEERRRRMFAIILIGAAIVLFVAVFAGGFATSTSTSDDSEDKDEAAEDEGDKDDKDEGDEGEGKADTNFPFNRTVVNSNEEDTSVFVDGVKQCDSTPCRISVPVGDGTSHEIRLKKDGYIDVVQNWQPKSVTEPLPALPDLKKL